MATMESVGEVGEEEDEEKEAVGQVSHTANDNVDKGQTSVITLLQHSIIGLFGNRVI